MIFIVLPTESRVVKNAPVKERDFVTGQAVEDRVLQFTLKWINTEFFIFLLPVIGLSEKINKGL